MTAKTVSIKTRSGDDLTPRQPAPMMRDSLSQRQAQRQAIRLANQAPMATRISDERIPLHQPLPLRYGPSRGPSRVLIFVAVVAIWAALVTIWLMV